MLKCYIVNFRCFRLQRVSALLLGLFFFCPFLWAAQDAIVVADRAIIFSDKDMTSPVGFVQRGKKIRVGEIPRNKAQVYPVVVSGRIAYIRVVDVTTEKGSLDAPTLSAERFRQITDTKLESRFVFSYYSFLTSVNLSHNNGKLKQNDPLLWHGLSARGETLTAKWLDLGVTINYMGADDTNEHFRVLETGLTAALRLYNGKIFLARLETQICAIPFSSYELDGQFRVKSYGFSGGGGLNLTWLLSEHWGVQTHGGLFYTRLLSFDTPDPYTDFAATFVGGRFGLGANYTY
jgi:hypothetical protein